MKKIIIVLIIIIFLEGLAIITLYQRSQMNMDLIELLAYRNVTNSELISNLQSQLMKK